MKRTGVIAAIAGAIVVICLVVLPESNGHRVVAPGTNVDSRSAAGPVRTQSQAAAAAAFVRVAEPTNGQAGLTLRQRIAAGDIPRVMVEELQRYLSANRRSAEALLGAFRASGDKQLLKEAAERFPNDPRVQFAAAFKADTAEERQQWLTKMKQSAPENSLPAYLLSSELMKAGRTAEALELFQEASTRPGFQNYLLDFVQNAEEAYHAGGYSEADAKAVGLMGAELPELSMLKQLSSELVKLSKRYSEQGDEAAANELRANVLNLSERMNDPSQVTLIERLVGAAIERMVLNSSDPAAPFAGAVGTVGDRLDTMAAWRKGIRELVEETDPIVLSLPNEDAVHFYERIKLYGEIAALEWVKGRAY